MSHLQFVTDIPPFHRFTIVFVLLLVVVYTICLLIVCPYETGISADELVTLCMPMCNKCFR